MITRCCRTVDIGLHLLCSYVCIRVPNLDFRVVEHEREKVLAAAMLVIRETFATNATLRDISRKSRMKHIPFVQVGCQQSFLRSFSRLKN